MTKVIFTIREGYTQSMHRNWDVALDTEDFNSYQDMRDYAVDNYTDGEEYDDEYDDSETDDVEITDDDYDEDGAHDWKNDSLTGGVKTPPESSIQW